MTCTRIVAIAAFTSLSIVGPIQADQRGTSATTTGRGSQARALLRGPGSESMQARISGFVITMHEPPRPVPNAAVRLRTTLGRSVETVRTGEKGEFAFVVAEAGSYYVELIDDKGRVLAVEDVGETAVSVTPGQVSTTIIRIPVALAQGAWLNAAKAILAAAASSGVAGVTTTGQPASPER